MTNPNRLVGPGPAPTPAVDDAAFARELNELLVGAFHSIERFEERSLRSLAGADLSVNEAHVVEAVGRASAGRPEGVTVTNLAEALSVRVPTATASVNRLVAKGLLAKERGERDARSVYVRLTRDGRRAYRLHALFHRRMVDAVAGQMTPEERAALASGVQKLKAFFGNQADGAPEGRRVVQNRRNGVDSPGGTPAGKNPAPHGTDELED